MAKRAKTLKILKLLLIPAMGAVSSAASARPAKPAVHAPAHAVTHAVTGHAAAHAALAKAGTRGSSNTHETARNHAEAAASGRRAKSRQAVEVKAEGRTHGAGTSHHVLRARDEERSRGLEKAYPVVKTARRSKAEARAEARAQAQAQAQTRGQTRTQTQARAEAPAPIVRREPRPAEVAARPVAPAELPVAQADEPIVKHDRKHHLPADAAPAVPSAPDDSKAGQAAATNVSKMAGTDAVAQGTAMLYSKSGHLIMPPAMKGTHEILIHQNVMADQDGLERVQDDEDLNRMRGAKTLMPLPEGPGLQTDDRLPGNRRFARPWTVKFLEAVAKAHYDRFHSALQVNSAVRTVEFQRNLIRVNGNAAPAEGETASPHLTGQAVDLAKKGLSMTEIAWLRGYLLPLVQQGKIDVEEEFQQSCFHISVYKKYVPEAAPRREIVGRPVAGSAIAAAMR